VRAAAAQMFVERRHDVGPARTRIAVEQRLGGYQNPREAIATLAGLLREDRLLERMQLLAVAQSFDRGDGLARDGRDFARAGVHRLAVQEHHAGAALLEAAAAAAAGRAERV